MCTIIIKKKGVALPSRALLEATRKANPHGFGFATSRECFKTMDFNEFVERLYKVRIDEDCIIHLRFATHGRTQKTNCHPFVGYLNNDPIYFAHNGVLSVTPDKGKTDSETAFRRIILPIAEEFGVHSQEFKDICEYLCGDYSKFAFIYKGEIITMGNYSEWGDLLVSNYRFSPYLKRESLYKKAI